jgi:putative ABC transport system permease protein
MKRSLRSWLWRIPLDQEVDEEIAFHIEMRTRELVERGTEPKAAREIVLARLGDLGQLKRTCIDLGRKRDREMRLTQWLEELRDDVTSALRQMKGSPGFTAVAALTLALGIGANSAIFAVADATLIHPLPFPEPDRLVMVWEQFGTITRGTVAPANARDWRERTRSFQGMASMMVGARTMTGIDGSMELFPGQQVSPEFFDVLGVVPILGRTFTPSDATPTPSVIVLSEAFWRRRFGSDPALVGRAIRLGNQSLTVIGVVPAAIQFLRQGNFWTIAPELRGVDSRGLHFMTVVGRLRPGVSIDAARSDMSAIAGDLAREYPTTNNTRGIMIESLRDAVVGREVRTTSMLLSAVVAFVLLLCCANVANLLLARTTSRARELALRSALGASRRRIVAQLLTESLVLAALGGVLGAGIGAVILQIAPSLIPAGVLPPGAGLAFDSRVVTFCAVITLAVGVLFGLAPAWHGMGASLAQAMSYQSQSATGAGTTVRALLVSGEVAAAVLLLCGAGLLLRTLLALENVDSGNRTQNVLTMQVDLPHGLPTSRYPTQESLHRFYDAAEEQVSTLRNVRAAGWATRLPLADSAIGSFFFDVVGDPPRAEGASRPLADYQIVSPSYFRALDLPIVAGRPFTERDATNSAPVCIVNEGFASRYLGGRNPIGMQISIRPMTLAPAPEIVREIVGVARQVKARPDEPEDLIQVYVPLAQNSWMSASLVVQPVDGPAQALAPDVRRAIAAVDKELAVTRVLTLDDVARQATARPRFRATLVATFAALALMLAMVGVFGVLAYSVQQRTREFGVRMALGAGMSDVIGMVLRSTVRYTGVGIVVGFAMAAIASQSIATLLFAVQPLDAVTFGSVAVLLALTAATAALAPAVRAARVNPVEAFRSE